MLLNAAAVKIQPDLIRQSHSADVLLHQKKGTLLHKEISSELLLMVQRLSAVQSETDR